MKSHTPLVSDELVFSVGIGRAPSPQDLIEVAARIWIDGAGGRTRALWDRLTGENADRRLALRAADMALVGG